MAEVVSARLGSDLLERLDDARGEASRSAWLAELVTRELTVPRGDGGHVVNSVSAQGPAGGATGTLGPGIPSPGVYCATPQCWELDTAKYGLRELPLCHACAHAACGLEYRRPMKELPPAWRNRSGSKQPEPAGRPA